MCAPDASQPRPILRSERTLRRSSCERRAHSTAHEQSPRPLSPVIVVWPRRSARRNTTFPHVLIPSRDGDTHNPWMRSWAAFAGGLVSTNSYTPCCRNHGRTILPPFHPHRRPPAVVLSRKYAIGTECREILAFHRITLGQQAAHRPREID